MKSIIFMICIVLFLSFTVSGSETASPNVTLKSGHIPTYYEIKTVWYGNGGNVPVSLSFTGPWDFTNGPKQRKFKEELCKTSEAFHGSEFPEAKYAVERIVGGQKSFEFRTKTSKGIAWYGSSGTSGLNNFKIVPPARTLFFPAKVGKELVQTGTVVDSAGNNPVTMKSKIVGKGTVIVGAGTFNDSVMVQHKIEIGGSDASSFILYEWYAPFVGKVVSIESQDGETKDLFTVAEVFEWMKSCAVP
jgi:hypothetical protein